MRLDAIDIGVHPPDAVNVVIEVPIGGEPIKYEMDKAAGTLVVDRFLHSPMRDGMGPISLCLMASSTPGSSGHARLPPLVPL
jgi:inorganic pyrophosphatase